MRKAWRFARQENDGHRGADSTNRHQNLQQGREWWRLAIAKTMAVAPLACHASFLVASIPI